MNCALSRLVNNNIKSMQLYRVKQVDELHGYEQTSGNNSRSNLSGMRNKEIVNQKLSFYKIPSRDCTDLV